jgi:hypothetical protein
MVASASASASTAAAPLRAAAGEMIADDGYRNALTARLVLSQS